MSYLNLASIIKRLRAGVVTLSEGEIKTLLNYLLERQDELTREIESLRGSSSTRNVEEQSPESGVRRGRKPKQDKGVPSSSAGDARPNSNS